MIDEPAVITALALAGAMDTGRERGLARTARLRPVQYEWNTRPGFYQPGNALINQSAVLSRQFALLRNLLKK